jgi:integrase
MGSIKKKTITRPMPVNATVTQKRTRRGTELVANWKDRSGKKRTAIVVTAADGSQRIRTESETYYAKFRDAKEILREVPTGCRDKQAALMKLSQLERRAIRVREGVLDSADLKIVENSTVAITRHLIDYLLSMESAGTTEGHREDTRRKIEILSDDCGFNTLRDITREAVEGWLVGRQKSGLAPRTRNSYLQAINRFLNWSCETGRLLINPLTRIKRADESVDRRRNRRALTETELNRLLFVVRWRPLAEYGRKTVAKVGEDRPEDVKSRKTWKMERLSIESIPEAVERAKVKLSDNPQFIEELDRRGWERSLVVKVAVLTGLRHNEIATLTIENLHLDESPPFIQMRSRDTKNRQADKIPLRDELSEDLRQWVKSKQEPQGGVLSLKIKRNGLPLSTLLFKIPKQFVKTLDRDFPVANIPKADDRGRTVDFHALRHTCGTLLSVGGVAPRTAQQVMRHSDIRLTMKTYTDPRLLDVAGAVNALPMLRLATEPSSFSQGQLTAGTGG